jgi:SAM-dependent methyltransferase
LTLISKITATQGEWEDLAHVDPLWAILSDRRKQFGGWNRDEFFASGKREIDLLMKSCGLVEGDNGRVLDFGCGIGRLSRALRSYFSQVYGLDISAEMIRLAKEYTPSCEFLLNQSDNLNLFQDDFFDFVYSSIVLQHQATKEAVQCYIKEFVRVAKPNGTIVFQMPYRLTLRGAVQPRRRAYSLFKSMGFSAAFLYHRLHLNPMRTICLPCAAVHAAVSDAGGQIVRSYSDDFNQSSMSYVVRKLPTALAM